MTEARNRPRPEAIPINEVNEEPHNRQNAYKAFTSLKYYSHVLHHLMVHMSCFPLTIGKVYTMYVIPHCVLTVFYLIPRG